MVLVKEKENQLTRNYKTKHEHFRKHKPHPILSKIFAERTKFLQNQSTLSQATPCTVKNPGETNKVFKNAWK